MPYISTSFIITDTKDCQFGVSPVNYSDSDESVVNV